MTSLPHTQYDTTPEEIDTWFAEQGAHDEEHPATKEEAQALRSYLFPSHPPTSSSESGSESGQMISARDAWLALLRASDDHAGDNRRFPVSKDEEEEQREEQIFRIATLLLDAAMRWKGKQGEILDLLDQAEEEEAIDSARGLKSKVEELEDQLCRCRFSTLRGIPLRPFDLWY